MTTLKRMSWIHMEDGTAEDYALMQSTYPLIRATRADKALKMLQELDNEEFQVSQVTRLEHSLQTATHAHEDGAEEELIVAALLHDVGDNIAMLLGEDHSEVAAKILRPFVSEKTHWVVQHHGIFQGYYYLHHFGGDRNLRDKFKGSPYYQDCVDFCHKYDQVAFDPDYPTKPLEFFEPMLRRIFAREPHTTPMTLAERSLAEAK